MPIIRFNNKVVYFSHIPKCGGSSVENFLKIGLGTELAFLDRNFYKQIDSRWSVSSPQHITGLALSRLFPVTFFDEFFTVIRNPLDRFCSAFVFQKYIAKRIHEKVDINLFISKLDHLGVCHDGKFDHHFLPQVKFLYPGAPYKVFKLENGLDHLRGYLNSLFSVDLSNIPMPHALKQPDQIKVFTNMLSQESKKIIENIYKVDFEKFNY